MKQISSYIFERLHINKTTGQNDTPTTYYVNGGNHSIDVKLDRIMWDKGGKAYFDKHMNKMEAYMKKGSNPKRLVGDIENITKLLNRWLAAIYLEWDDAIDTFGNAIAERLNLTIEDLHQYICNQYRTVSGASGPKYIISYKKLYNIEFENK